MKSVSRNTIIFTFVIILSLLCSSTSSVSTRSKECPWNNAGLQPPTLPSEDPGCPPAQGPTPMVDWSFMSLLGETTPYSCAELADVNLDGNLDVIAGTSSQGIDIWTGNGVWTPMSSPTTSGGYDHIAVGDLNNDGKPDIVAAHGTGISAWSGDGNGSWGNMPVTTSAFPFNAVTLDDINLDGNMDIVGATFGNNFLDLKGVQVFLGDGSGGWTHGDNNLPENGVYISVTTGDFNNDGNPDIAATRNNRVMAWIGDGAGSWTLRNNGLPSSGTYSDVKFGDFNLDGKLDIVATHRVNGGVTVWNGDGWGIWTPTFDLPSTGSYTGVEVEDVNIDGYMDIMTSSSSTNETVWTGDGADNWYLQTSGFPSGNSYEDIAVGDVDNDGRLDMCLVNSSIGIDIWTSSVSRSVNAWTTFPAPTTTVNVNDIEVFDVNLDSIPDICYATEANGAEIWTGDGTGVWTSFTSPITAGTYYSAESTDFNKDGKPDLVGTSNLGIGAAAGDSLGGWQNRLSGLPSTGNWYGLAIADFNDDGNPDIAAGSGDNGGVMVWNGDGWGIWNPTFNLPFTGTYYDLCAEDVNQDGMIDLVAADGGINVFLGDGNDGWTESSGGLPDPSLDYRGVEVADLNDDGNFDIVGASSDPAGVNVWLGDGSGGWTFDSNVADYCNRGLTLGDFSIDGRIDICSGSDGGNNGVVGNKQNGGAWEEVSDGLSLTGEYKAMQLIDINIDGRLDIVTANATAGGTHIWVGDFVDQGPPAAPTALTVEWWGTTTTTIYDEDFEGDGSPTFSELGWTIGGASNDWQIGTPAGLGGEYGFPDPVVAHSGSFSIGNDLTGLGSYFGDYEMDIGTDSNYIYSPPIDCSGATGTTLGFWRCLNVEEPAYDHAYIEVSNNGTVWTEIWTNPVTLEDSNWNEVSYDISGAADGEPTVYVRFEIGPTDGGWQYSGWNIDDVRLTDQVISTDHNMLNWTLSSDDGAGENDVVKYNVYRADNEAGPWNVSTYIDSVPAGTDTYTDPNRGEFDGINWWYVVRAEDSFGNEDNNTVAVPEFQVSFYNISVTAGWNLISYPLLANGPVQNVLDDSAGDGATTWNIARWYDPNDPSDPWKTYASFKPPSLNDMPDVDRTMGLWVYVTAAGDGFLTVEGQEPTTTNISLMTGWNHVGYPSDTPRLASATLPVEADMISVFDGAQPYLIRDETDLASVTMSSGNAYWVHCTFDTIWSVDYL